MLSKLIISSYKTLAEMLLWLLLIGGGTAGGLAGASFHYGDTIYVVIGAVAGVIATFFAMSIILGATMVLGEILQTVKNIETEQKRKIMQPVQQRMPAPPPKTAAPVKQA